MRVREASGKRGLVAGLLILASCGGGPPPAPEVPLESARTAEELRSLLATIVERRDHEAAIARARVYDRLRGLGEPGPALLLARGDAADLELLSLPAPPALRAEAAARLSRHFRERAQTPGLRRAALTGPLGDRLGRVVLLTIASTFGECASPAEEAAALERLAAAARELATLEGARPEARRDWQGRAERHALRAREVLAEGRPRDVAPNARKFCEEELGRHLQEGTRAADFGTREKVARGDPARVLEWYLEALAHFMLVGECLLEPTPAQHNALSAMEIVAGSVCDLLLREP